jgi:hypothetical protein
VISESLKEEAEPTAQTFVDSYAWFIVAEVKHFMRINSLGKVKQKHSPVEVRPKMEPNIPKRQAFALKQDIDIAEEDPDNSQMNDISEIKI